MTSVVNKIAFRLAAQRGEISTLERFFQQDDAMDEAMEVEAWIDDVRTSDPEILDVLETMLNENQVYREELPRAFLDVWFRDDDTSALSRAAGTIPLSTLEWFFGASSLLASLVPRTLAVLMPLTIACAIHKEDSEAVEMLFTSHVFVDLLTEKERKSVFRRVAEKLISCGSRRMVDLVISHGVNVQEAELSSIEFGWLGLDALNANGGIPVGYQRCFEATRLPADYLHAMAQFGADLRTSASTWHAIVKTNKTKVVKYLVTEIGHDVDSPRRSDGRAALIEACDTPACSLGTIKTLLRLGADVNATGTKGAAARINAAALSRLDVVRLLLHNGAAVDIADPLGRTAVHIACEVGSTGVVDIVSFLLAYGADPNACDCVGRSPLHILAQTDTPLLGGWNIMGLLSKPVATRTRPIRADSLCCTTCRCTARHPGTA